MYDNLNREIACYHGDNIFSKKTYDNFNNVILEDSLLEGKQYFEYDSLGRKTKVMTPSKNYIATYTYLFEYYKTASKDTYSVKISNNTNNYVTYLTMENGNETSYVIMNGPSYYYRRTSEYNEYNQLFHLVDSNDGEFWYFYYYDDNGNILKKLTVKNIN